MFFIRVERIVKKDIDTVFDLLSDHEGYARFKSVRKAVLLEEGHTEKRGVGALRELQGEKMIANLSTCLTERITRFEAPVRMDYHIEKFTLPLRHDVGEIHLSEEETAQGNFTRVVWISQGHVKVPVLGSLVLDKLMQKQGTAVFHSMLKTLDKI